MVRVIMQAGVSCLTESIEIFYVVVFPCVMVFSSHNSDCLIVRWLFLGSSPSRVVASHDHQGQRGSSQHRRYLVHMGYPDSMF
jgi:hypothetical protein